jgi:thiol-disulfide isomerase/thioredoxin
MYRKSFFMVVLSLIVMGLLASGTKMVMAIPGLTGLPSSYDPHVRMEDAMQTSTKPLLVEFYTDTCGTCKVLTPWVHQLKDKYADDLTFVMVDVSDARNSQVAQIFNITFVPSIFVFDAKHMTKAQVSSRQYGSKDAVDKGIADALATMKSKVAAKASAK